MNDKRLTGDRSFMADKKLAERNIPGMMNRNNRFAEAEHAEHVGATLKRILTYFAREKFMVFGMLAIVVTGTLCGVYAPSLQSRAIDIIAGTKGGMLASTLLLMMSVYLIYSGCQLFQGVISARLSQRIVRRMREELFSKIVGLPIRYLDTHSHGDVMSRMTNDIENISTTVSQSLPSLFSGVLTIAGTVAVMVYYCWQLALLSCVTVLLTLMATKFLSKKVRRFSRKRQQLLGQLNGTVEEMVSGYRTVVAYNHQKATTAVSYTHLPPEPAEQERVPLRPRRYLRRGAYSEKRAAGPLWHVGGHQRGVRRGADGGAGDHGWCGEKHQRIFWLINFPISGILLE